MKSKLCWFSFYETEFGTESSYLKSKPNKVKTRTKKWGGKEFKEPQQVNSKTGDFGKKSKTHLGKK